MIMNDSPKDLIDRQVLLEMKVFYMCRYFKRHMNISLSEYRKSNNK